MTLDSAAVHLALEVLGPIGSRDHPLGPLTTYRVGGCAAIHAAVAEPSHLDRVVEVHRATGVPLVVIGRGSNMLVADRGFDGLAVSLSGLDRIEVARPGSVSSGGDDRVVVEAGAAVALPVLARRVAAAGLSGFEWGVGVPGSIGGAVRMNAGGHGSDMASSLVDADVLDLASGRIERIPVDRLGLGFRSSGLADHEIVISARLALVPGDRTRIEESLAEIVRWRREHQPGGQNCGSVFVNPIPGLVPAAALIEDSGLRGLRLGSAQVSSKHANFIQADEGGRADDVRALIETVRDRVAARTGFRLRSEVRLVGYGEARVGPAGVDAA